MSALVRCAICGVLDDPANMDLIFQEGTTYPDHWQCKDPCDDPDYDDLPEEPEEPENLGSCCACGGFEKVRNIIMLSKRGPVKGRGWGCLQCGLPQDGAIAVMCDACHESRSEVKFACSGYPGEGVRVPIDMLDPAPFEHDMALHPGEI